MANHVSHASLPYPIKNARYTIIVPYLDSTGTPTDPTTPDTEFSLDAGAFADCAEEVTTISGSNGEGYITLTGAETNGSMLGVAAKVASGPKNTLATLYPRVLPIVGSGTLSAGSAGGGTLGTLLAYDVTGCFIRTTGGTGGGGTGGANNQARKIITYNVTTGAFTVAPNWETNPSTDTTYDVLLPDGLTLGALKALNPATAGRTLVVDAAGLADANAVKLGPTGAGTSQTARDVGAGVNVTQILGVAVPPRYTGTSQAATLATITLANGTTALQAALGDVILITSGVGAGQSGSISSQTGMGTATPICTITNSNGGWATLPSASGYEIIKAGQIVPVVATAGGNLPSDLRALGGVVMTGDGSVGNNLRPTGIPVG